MSICKQDKGVGTTDVVHSYTKPGRAKFISFEKVPIQSISWV